MDPNKVSEVSFEEVPFEDHAFLVFGAFAPCLPSSHEVITVQMKNCEPFVSGPLFAIESVPGPVCFNWRSVWVGV